MGPCFGIDVAKHTLEWTPGSAGRIQHTRNEPRPIAALVRRLVALEQLVDGEPRIRGKVAHAREAGRLGEFVPREEGGPFEGLEIARVCRELGEVARENVGVTSIAPPEAT